MSPPEILQRELFGEPQVITSLRESIHSAFSNISPPRDEDIFAPWAKRHGFTDSRFLGITDWRQLPGSCFRAVDTTLSAVDITIFSDAAFHFFAPAYMAADLDGHLGYGASHFSPFINDLDDRAKAKGRFDDRAKKLSVFSAAQAEVVVGYLALVMAQPHVMDMTRRDFQEALENFWLDRAQIDPREFWLKHERLADVPVPRPFVVPAELEAGISTESLKAEVRTAFDDLVYPGDHNIRGSDLGCEPYEVEAAYKGKDWRDLDGKTLDAQGGFSFLSHAAFRYYMPAFLLAGLADALLTEDPVFHLTYGFTDEAKVNRGDADRTWFDYYSERCREFNPLEARVIARYLLLHRSDEYSGDAIRQALANFWIDKALPPQEDHL